jgi:hypothetical protein
MAGSSVYHMSASAYVGDDQNQARPVRADHDLERAIIDMVGDLAAYNPGAKVVIFEGEESEFDIFMASTLFPELPAKVNLVPGTNKTRVRGLHALLDRLQATARLPPMRVYSITDKDSDPEEQTITTRFSWDRYHIENYLLEPAFIRLVLQDLNIQMSDADIEMELKACAQATVNGLVVHQVCLMANRKLVAAIRTDVDPKSASISFDLSQRITTTANRISELETDSLSEASLQRAVRDARVRFDSDFATGEWKKTVRGRDVLRVFVDRRVSGISYERFRNLIISRMRDSNFQPAGMKRILDGILAPTPIVRAS